MLLYLNDQFIYKSKLRNYIDNSTIFYSISRNKLSFYFIKFLFYQLCLESNHASSTFSDVSIITIYETIFIVIYH